MQHNALKIPIDASFSFKECLWFLDRHFDDCLHEVNTKSLRKALYIGKEPVLLEITQVKNHLCVSLLQGDLTEKNGSYIRQYMSDWLDLDLDIQPFYKLLTKHTSLTYMVKSYRGLRLVGIPDLFEALAWSIIGQQINLTFAYRLKRRLVEKYGKYINYKDARYYLFPSYETIATVNPSDLHEMQFSAKKAEYLIGLAKAFEKGDISKSKLISLPELKSRQKTLTDIRGIGTWTANYALMKSLKERSCIPYGDAGLLNALIQHQIIQQKDDAEGIDKFFRRFAGWESYLVFYLWRSLSPTKQEIIKKEIK